jgi:NADPH-dependent 2,4-dienoyl-CoA reductase/sulfur reductase-like enzyme
MTTVFDVVVVGLGPAGMAAASSAARAGLKVAVVDENPAPGGQVYRQGLSGLCGSWARKGRGDKLLKEFERHQDQMEIIHNAVVWASLSPNSLNLLKDGSLSQLEYKRLIICEGAQERTIPFPGWTLPGVVTAGGLQKLILHQRVLPGKSMVFAGAGPLLFASAAAALKAGAKVLAVCDANPRSAYIPLMGRVASRPVLIAEGLHYMSQLVKQRVPILYSKAVVEAIGDEKLSRVVLADINPNGAPLSGRRKELEADVLGLNYGFVPASRLTRLLEVSHTFDPMQRGLVPVCDRFGRTSNNQVLVAGDGAGVGGADYAALAGRLAALAAASDVTPISPDELNRQSRPILREMAVYRKYAERLHALTAPKPGLYQSLDDETIICRCEGTSVAKVKEFMAKTGGSLTELKASRISMGPCQGRICEPILLELLSVWGCSAYEIGELHLRPPLAPIPLRVFENEANNNYFKSEPFDTKPSARV